MHGACRVHAVVWAYTHRCLPGWVHSCSCNTCRRPSPRGNSRGNRSYNSTAQRGHPTGNTDKCTRYEHALHTHISTPAKPTTQNAHRALFAGKWFFLAGWVWFTLSSKATTTHSKLISVRVCENVLVHLLKGNINHLEVSPEFSCSVVLLLACVLAAESDVAIAHWHGILAPLATRGVCAHIRSWGHDLW